MMWNAVIQQQFWKKRMWHLEGQNILWPLLYIFMGSRVVKTQPQDLLTPLATFLPRDAVRPLSISLSVKLVYAVKPVWSRALYFAKKNDLGDLAKIRGPEY